MSGEWNSRTTQELVRALSKQKQRIEHDVEAFQQDAATDDPNADLSERRKEIGEAGMILGMLKQEIAERHARNLTQELDALVPVSQAPLSPEEITAHLSAAESYLEDYEYQLAIGEYNAVLLSNPSHAEAYYYRGCTFNELNKYQLAINDFTQAIQLQPEMVEAYRQRSEAHSRLRQYLLVIEDLTHVIRLLPQDAEAHQQRGLAFALMEQYEQALSDFDHAIGIDPTDEAAYYFRAGVHMELGDYDRALGDCRICLEYRPTWRLPQSRIEEIEKLRAGG
jgi:tetratricopeptide (TPR) repeat protein